MKDRTNIPEHTEHQLENLDGITRKQALKDMGKYAALLGLGTFMILNPQKAQAASPPEIGGDPFARQAAPSSRDDSSRDSNRNRSQD